MISTEHSVSDERPLISWWIIGFMFLIYSSWSRVIKNVVGSWIWRRPQLVNEYHSTFNSPKTSWIYCRTHSMTFFLPVSFRSSTCLAIRQTRVPIPLLDGSNFRTSSPSTEDGIILHLFLVTCESLRENALGASTRPVPGLSQWRTSVCSSKSSNPGTCFRIET